jgi:methyl-accepting chemotaxis protein
MLFAEMSETVMLAIVAGIMLIVKQILEWAGLVIKEYFDRQRGAKVEVHAQEIKENAQIVAAKVEAVAAKAETVAAKADLVASKADLVAKKVEEVKMALRENGHK